MSASDPDALPAGYADVLDELRAAIQTSRVQASRAVNTEMVALYWRIGHTILRRQQEQGWGARVIERLSVDPRTEFPGMRGLSPRSLVYMRTLAAADERPIAQQPVAQLPWGHVTTLLARLREDPTGRHWHAAQALSHGWSRFPPNSNRVRLRRHSHKYTSMRGQNGEEVWDSYVENNVTSAWGLFWHYGPGDRVITIVAISPHP